MPTGRYQPPDGYLTLAQARERLAVSHTKVWMMVKDGTLRVYEDPRDRRVKLVRAEDVEALARPRLRDGGDSSAVRRGVGGHG